MRHSATSFLGFIFAWAVLLWPPIVNGAPFLMPDTTTYIRGVDAGVFKITKIPTEWTDEYLKRFTKNSFEQNHADISGSNKAGRTTREEHPIVLAGRSIFYGLILYISYLLGGFWITLALQALLTALCISLTLARFRERQGGAPRPWELPLVAALLALLTPIGYFVGFLMPDFSLPLTILAFCHIALFWNLETRARRIFWGGILAFGALAHSATLLIVILMAGVTAALSLARFVPMQRQAFLPVALTLGIALMGETGFSLAVKATTGAPPVRPPFLTARIIADGPGYAYLRSHCPQSGFTICRYLDRLPAPSDDFLWDPRPTVGVFSAVPPDEGRALAAEQSRFVLAVFLDRPFEFLSSSFSAGIRQAVQLGLEDFNYYWGRPDIPDLKLPHGFRETIERSAAYRNKMPVRWIDIAIIPVALLSLLFILWWGFRMRKTNLTLVSFAGLACLGLLLNAFVCGAFSTPHERYQSRSIWLLPLLAICLAEPARRRRPPAQAENAPAHDATAFEPA